MSMIDSIIEQQDAEIESLRSRLAAAQDSANTWHTRAEVHRQAAENAEAALVESDALLREARGELSSYHWLRYGPAGRPPSDVLIDRIDAHLSRKEGP